MKNILIIHSSLKGGGAERVLIELLNHIDYTEYNVELIIVFNNGIYFDQLFPNISVRTIYKKGYRNFFIRRLIKSGLGQWYEKMEINKVVTKNYDVIISFMEGIPLKYHSLITNRAKRNLTWVHTNMLTNHWTKLYFRSHLEEENCYKQMDEIVFVSQDAKLSFQKEFSVNKPLKVIHNVIDKKYIIEKKSEFEVNKTKFTICTAGRLDKNKNHLRLIEAASILKDKGCLFDLWILGQGVLENDIKKQIINRKLENNVHLLGFCSNPYPYMAAADIFVLSSDTEGYPTVICEALCLGKTVVSTKVSGITTLLGNSEYGYVTDFTAESIAETIYKLYCNRHLISTMGKKAMERSEIFSTDRQMTDFYTIINK